ncbi:hypothetical protein JHK82_034926 [Glycine max]|uniref:Uncharacterized protein n=2 Tax=Glycine subgen. Soja TaxID=1462606 RepID=A0A0R0GRL1_SOYBN|nr:hypothetical protein JHK87_034889 [Glycine soja]KAG4969214.1 hypothetical protein JHK85_035635 [Glycine max]KAG4975575.1 hypothetical protein JHK86_035049 [Glycine max]KAG5111657.1 hypothetical protein JHK82_034926 [Glycine max]KAG5128951.1 hypothetical protein JHK84_035348 [Glycine max]
MLCAFSLALVSKNVALSVVNLGFQIHRITVINLSLVVSGEDETFSSNGAKSPILSASRNDFIEPDVSFLNCVYPPEVDYHYHPHCCRCNHFLPIAPSKHQ